jgi:FkbM family methyltransferase
MDRIIRILGRVAGVLPMGIKRGIYQLPWAARIVRRALNRTLPQGLTEVEITAGAAQGLRMRLDLQQEKDYWLGTYEPDLQEAIRELIRPGWVVYDIGANVGYITLMLACKTAEDGRVLAFEPLPENVERLKENIALNNMNAWVTVIAAAVVDSPGTVRFWVGPSDDMGKADGSAGRNNVPYYRSMEVQGVSLDGLIYQDHYPIPQAIKMDIEGGEVLALRGMEQTLRQARPIVLLELHGEESARQAWQVFQESGYRLHRMEKAFPQVTSLEALDWKAYVVAFPPDFTGSGER